MSRGTTLLLARVVAFNALLGIACQSGPAPAPAAGKAAPAPPAPRTSLGALVRVERTKTAPLQVRCIKQASDRMVGVVGEGTPMDSIAVEKRGEQEVFTGKPGSGMEVMAILDMVGVCALEEPAAEGREFLVLSFEGKAERSVNEDGSMAKFVPAGAGGVLSRADGKSHVQAGATSSPGLVLSAEEAARKLAFDVPAGTKGLVWHDGTQRYQLEPHPVPLPGAPPASGK